MQSEHVEVHVLKAFKTKSPPIVLPVSLAPNRIWTLVDPFIAVAVITIGWVALKPFEFGLIWVAVLLSVPMGLFLFVGHLAKVRAEIDEKGLSLCVWNRRYLYPWSDIKAFEVRRTLIQTVLDALPEDNIGSRKPVQIRHFNGLDPFELRDFLNEELERRKTGSEGF